MFIRVKVLSNQPKSRLRATLTDGTIKIDIAASREKGKANKELQRFLAQHYQVAKARVRIVNGHTSAIKLVEIEK